MIIGLGCHKGSFRSGKVDLRGESCKKREIQGKKEGKRCDTNQDSGNMYERTSIEVNRPESGRAGGLLHI